MANYVVVKTHNFDVETEAVEFDDYRKATAYLHWVWEDCLNDEMVEDSYKDEDENRLDEEECYHEETYAKVQWDNGDWTEFTLITVTPQRDDFPDDWENYAM